MRRSPRRAAATRTPVRRIRSRAALAIVVPSVLLAAFAPSAEARKMTCEPGVQWTTAYMRYATKQTVKFTNTSTALRSESYRTQERKQLIIFSRRYLNVDPPGDIDTDIATFHAQYGYGNTGFAAKREVLLPGNVLRGVRVPARRRVIVHERVRFWRVSGQYLVTPDDPKFGAASKAAPGLPPGCTLRTVGAITMAAPIDVAEPQKVVLRLKKKS